MGLLDWLKPKASPQKLAAERLATRIFSAAQIATVASLGAPCLQHPNFERIANGIQDRFLLTLITSAVPLTMHRVSLQATPDSKEDVFGCLLSHLREFNNLAPKLFIDCWEFLVKAKTDVSESSADAGVWLIWNLKGARPTSDEFREGAMQGIALGQFATQWFDAGL